MKKINILIVIIFVLACISCQKTKTYKDKLQIHYENLDPQELVIKKYNEALFDLDTTDFVNSLKAIQPEYQAFLKGNLDNPNAVNFLKSFATDTFCIRINNMVEQKFQNDERLINDIKAVYQRLNYYYPDIQLPPTYFYISGVDYETPPVMISNEGVMISLDFYLGNDTKIYDYIGMQRFRSARCRPSYITRDLAYSIYFYYLYKSRIQKDVLSEMIYTGKRNYFVEALNPSLPDSILLGYTSKQMQWAGEHEGDVWASIVGNDMLYAKGLDPYRTFFSDGPFTQAYSNDAPARLGEFIGLQIIRSYMTNNDVTLQELIDNNDIQQIFQKSMYKPKKN